MYTKNESHHQNYLSYLMLVLKLSQFKFFAADFNLLV